MTAFVAPASAQQPIQLPQITVATPSPIRRPRPGAADQHRAGRAARTGPTAAAAGHAADRHRSVRDRHRGAARGIATQLRLDARRCSLFQARHHRLELRAGRIEPPDRARPRRQSRRHCRQRHRRRRRVRSGRRSFRAGQSARDRSRRGDPRTRDLALRLAVDRRCCRLDQQPHSRALPCNPSLPPRGASRVLARISKCAAPLERRQRPRRRRDRRCRRRQFRLPRRCVRPPHAGLPRAELSLSYRARRSRASLRDAARRLQRAAAEFLHALRRSLARRLVFFRRRLSPASRSPRTTTSMAFPARRRGHAQPHRRAPEQGHQQGRIPPAVERASTRSAIW